MWSHYMALEIRVGLGVEKFALKKYFELTSLAVLVLLLAHPALLIYQRYRDGAGLPPGSYQSYVAPSMAWITLLGTVSLVAFLAFEFRRVYGKRSWWHFVEEAGDLAMLAIFYHGLQLGQQINGWYRYVWFFLGITLVLVLVDKYYKRYFTKAAN